MLYRDFTYLDVDRVQSILAQLEEGLLTDVITGRQREFTGKAGMTAGLLSQFLPVKLSAEGKLARDVRETKVLHDYAYAIALQSLRDHDLLLDMTEVARASPQIPEDSFILVNGQAQIIDYQSLRHIAVNEDRIDRILGASQIPAEPHPGDNVRTQPPEHVSLSRQQLRALERQTRKPANSSRQMERPGSPSARVFGGIDTIIDVFYGDLVQNIVTNHEGLRFVGILDRIHLRESLRSLIFKYGSQLQGNWFLLAQVTRIPAVNESPNLSARLAEVDADIQATATGATASLNKMFTALNAFQEALGTVAYPDVAVSPIALYREVRPLD